MGQGWGEEVLQKHRAAQELSSSASSLSHQHCSGGSVPPRPLVPSSFSVLLMVPARTVVADSTGRAGAGCSYMLGDGGSPVRSAAEPRKRPSEPGQEKQPCDVSHA